MRAINNSVIQSLNISHSFSLHDKEVVLFKHLNLSIAQTHSYAITGPSGAGKSSLLMLLSGLEQAKSGQVQLNTNGKTLPIAACREHIGFIFQQFHLLPELTALNNVALPLRLRSVKNANEQAASFLDKVGLSHRLDHKPAQLSGGEQQRVAIARALVFKPSFIFADEPTGNLDANSAHEVANILFDCCRDNAAGLVLVTHSGELADRAEHVFTLKNGECHVDK